MLDAAGTGTTVAVEATGATAAGELLATIAGELLAATAGALVAAAED